MNEMAKKPIVLDRVDNAEDCKRFLHGVLTTPGFKDQAMKLVDPKGGFFSDAMTENTLEEFVNVQQGPIIELVPDFTILNWRYAIDDGDVAVLKFQATASHKGKRATWTCVWIFTLKDGKIDRLEKTFDRASWHTALGLPAWTEMPVQPPFESYRVTPA